MVRGPPSRRSRIPACLFLGFPIPSHPAPAFCTAIILYYKLALVPDPGQHEHARETQHHTHRKTGRLFFFFLSLSPGCVLGVRSGVGGGGVPGPGRRACTETLPLDCEYCTNPTLETDTHTRGAAGEGGGTRPRTPAHTATHRRGWGGAPPSGVAVRGILCLLKSLYVNADNPESLCTTKS